MPSTPQTLPSPIPPKDLSAGALRSRPAGPRQPAGAISKVAWIPHEELGRSEWLSTGRRLGAIGRCSQWWIGDWIRYGTAKWGEKYAEAARVTGYDIASLRNMAWVASRFDISLRSDKLAWSHHVLLAPLEPPEQRRWLERASEERFSVSDLRLALRAERECDEESSADDAPIGLVEKTHDAVVCPRCGHKLDSPAE